MHPCHICGGSNHTRIYHQSFSGLSSGSFLKSYDVCVCDQCGFGFADGLPPAESFEKYYAEMSKWDYLESDGVESDEHLQRFEKVADDILSMGISKQTPVLDIGCSTGGMLAALKRRGFTNLTGLDPSPKSAELAKSLHEIEVVTGAVKDLNQLPKNFGLVMLSGVLEHFYDPDSAIRDIRNLMVEGGMFYVSVPDVTRFASCFDAPYQQFSLEHILYFSPESLTNLLRKSGFKPAQIKPVLYPYTRSFDYPVIEALFQKTEASTWVPDQTTLSALNAYVKASATVEEKISSQIEKLVSTQEPILVWGVGTQTQRLMSSGHLSKANITAFIDSNAHYHGKLLHDKPIISPKEAGNYNQPILISSIIFRAEITEQIRQELKLSNRLIAIGCDEK
jgi:2-polyprenyl-3-methyl-5-hydroxy-6-metoxy-1,4-benzoquinol methylase